MNWIQEENHGFVLAWTGFKTLKDFLELVDFVEAIKFC